MKSQLLVLSSLIGLIYVTGICAADNVCFINNTYMNIQVNDGDGYVNLPASSGDKNKCLSFTADQSTMQVKFCRINFTKCAKDNVLVMKFHNPTVGPSGFVNWKAGTLKCGHGLCAIHTGKTSGSIWRVTFSE